MTGRWCDVVGHGVSTVMVEMTANVTMLLPVLGASFVAMLLPTLLGNAPIYDSLRPQSRQRDGVPDT
jgi:H+/Cl- antiporter ClcA